MWRRLASYSYLWLKILLPCGQPYSAIRPYLVPLSHSALGLTSLQSLKPHLSIMTWPTWSNLKKAHTNYLWCHILTLRSLKLLMPTFWLAIIWLASLPHSWLRSCQWRPFLSPSMHGIKRQFHSRSWWIIPWKSMGTMLTPVGQPTTDSHPCPLFRRTPMSWMSTLFASLGPRNFHP